MTEFRPEVSAHDTHTNAYDVLPSTGIDGGDQRYVVLSHTLMLWDELAADTASEQPDPIDIARLATRLGVLTEHAGMSTAVVNGWFKTALHALPARYNARDAQTAYELETVYLRRTRALIRRSVHLSQSVAVQERHEAYATATRALYEGRQMLDSQHAWYKRWNMSSILQLRYEAIHEAVAYEGTVGYAAGLALRSLGRALYSHHDTASRYEHRRFMQEQARASVLIGKLVIMRWLGNMLPSIDKKRYTTALRLLED